MLVTLKTEGVSTSGHSGFHWPVLVPYSKRLKLGSLHMGRVPELISLLPKAGRGGEAFRQKWMGIGGLLLQPPHFQWGID